MTNRVVITGMGGVSSIGMSVPEIYNSMKEGKSGIGILEFPDVARLKVKTGGQIKNFDANDYFELKKIARMDRFSQFALLAANEAIMSSGLKNSQENWSENPAPQSLSWTAAQAGQDPRGSGRFGMHWKMIRN